MLNALANLLIAAQMMMGLPQAQAEAPAEAPASVTTHTGGGQDVEASATATGGAPTSQPTQVTVNVTTADGSPVEDPIARLYETKVGQLFQGKKQVTLDEMMTIPFWFDTIQELVVVVLGFIPRLIVATLLFCVFWLIYRGVRRLAMGSLKSANVDPSIRDMLGSLIKWAILGFGLVIAFNQIGIQIAALLTGVSIIGLAIGFAAQETLANFIAGVVIFWDKPFKVGDWIEVDGQLAEVVRVTFRSTRMHNLDNDVVVMPNTAMLSQKLINKSTNPITRVTVDIGIAYKDSIDAAREVLLATVTNDRRIVTSPKPVVEVRACAASSVDLQLHFWIRDEAYEDAMKWEFLERAKKAIDAAGIEIPFPHVQLLVEESRGVQLLSNAMQPAHHRAA